MKLDILFVTLSLVAFTCASPIEQLQQTKSTKPDISSLPLESAQKPADVTKTSFDADKTKPNNAKPQTPSDGPKTTSTIQNTGAQNTPQIASSTQQNPSLGNQKTQPQQQQSWLNNNNNQKAPTSNTNVRTPNHSQYVQVNPSLLSSSSRVRRDTVKTPDQAQGKTGTPAATTVLQNSAKQQNSQQRTPTSAPVRKTREAPKEAKPASSTTTGQNAQSQSQVKTPVSQNTQTQKVATNAQKTPINSPVRKTREVPKDSKAPAPAPALTPKQPQTQFTHDVKKTPLTASATNADRKTREAPKKESAPTATAQKNQPQTPVNAPKTPVASAPSRKTREAPKKESAPTATAQKNQPQTPVNAPKTPVVSAPPRKTREAPNPTEQSKIVPSTHNVPLKSAENPSHVTELKPQTFSNNQPQPSSSLPAYHHPVPVDQILKKPAETSSPSQSIAPKPAVNTANTASTPNKTPVVSAKTTQ